MAEITGRFISDLLPNGTVRMVFIASRDGGNERPLLSKNLDAALNFMKSFVTPEKAMTLRAQLERDKMADAVISIDKERAATFRNLPLRMD